MLARLLAARWAHGPIILMICLAVYWPGLGSSGFSSSEGHRVIPGWTMLDTGDFWRVQMFGQPYLRKPPGMPWAIAASAALLGETEFSARAVSALACTLMALVAFAGATRWFGAPWGLPAGVAQALAPVFWLAGRAAEIEALNALAVQGGVFLLIDLLVPRSGRCWWHATLVSLGAGATITLAALAKGYAGAPVLGAAVAGACLAQRSLGPLRRPWVYLSLAVAATILTPIASAIVKANAGASGVAEDLGKFYWSFDHLLAIASLAPACFFAALPWSLSLIVPYLAAARAPDHDLADAPDRPRLIARALALTWILAIAVCTFAGLSNPRYGMAAAVVLAPLVGFAARWAAAEHTRWSARRRLINRLACLGHPLGWVAFTTIGAAVYLPIAEASRDRNSGRGAGLELGAAFDTTAGPRPVVWADGLIEARPEVLLYAARQHPLDIRWMKPAMLHATLPPAGAFIVLRGDTDGNEQAAYADAIRRGTLQPVTPGSVHKFDFVLYRVGPAR